VKITVIAALAAAIPVLALSGPAQAEVLASAKAPNLCLDVNQANNQVILWGCHGAANQNFFTSAYGQQRFNGLCLDFEGAAGTQRGANLMMRGCDPNKRSQRWTLVNDMSAPGALRNEEGWCADVFQGNAYQGQKIVAWDCKWGIDITRDNQTFVRGRFGPASALGAPQLQNAQPGTLIRGGSLVAAGGGNLVAAGGGNLVAAGGGNVIAASGGGLVAAGGGN
jgi:hypothetical protein